MSSAGLFYHEEEWFPTEWRFWMPFSRSKMRRGFWVIFCLLSWNHLAGSGGGNFLTVKAVRQSDQWIWKAKTALTLEEIKRKWDSHLRSELIWIPALIRGLDLTALESPPTQLLWFYDSVMHLNCHGGLVPFATGPWALECLVHALPYEINQRPGSYLRIRAVLRSSIWFGGQFGALECFPTWTNLCPVQFILCLGYRSIGKLAKSEDWWTKVDITFFLKSFFWCTWNLESW